jgi:glutamate dehydrogenase (NAD(P)+)
VVQGLGNVGYFAAKFFQEAGAKIVAIAEWDGSIYNPDGIDVDAVQAYRQATKSILNFPDAKNFKKNTDALEYECDILIPAALEQQITLANASNIKTKIIVEAANGPVTADAEEILLKKGIMIIPDAYANAGGVTVSYFEWLKNLNHVRFGRLSKRFEERSHDNFLGMIERLTGKSLTDSDRNLIVHGADEIDFVNSGLEETMYNAYDEIRETWLKNSKVEDLRTASFVNAINKIAVAYMNQGIFP